MGRKGRVSGCPRGFMHSKVVWRLRFYMANGLPSGDHPVEESCQHPPDSKSGMD